MSGKLYPPDWRDKIRPGVQSSAAALVPDLAERFQPSSVVDVGCGEGWFLREFEALGVQTTGADGSWVDGVEHVDLTAPPYPALGRFDLAISLEVGEHVDGRFADDLVAWLLALAPTVVFSAAIPKQGGPGHVNEQWPAYWLERFAHHGAAGTGVLRWAHWDDARIEPWYRQNLLVFGDLHGLAPDGCPSVVHPDIWSIYR